MSENDAEDFPGWISPAVRRRHASAIRAELTEIIVRSRRVLAARARADGRKLGKDLER
jgi:riboflavin biosynthesis pyrimidine reductase